MWSLWRKTLAFFRLDLSAVCEESSDAWDYHDYPDSTVGEPWHFVTHECKRCGRQFQI